MKKLNTFALLLALCPVLRATESQVERLPLEPHKRVLEKTFLFPRIQSKYSLVQNYLDSYCRTIFTDRPLYFNRELAEGIQIYTKNNVPKGLAAQIRTSLEFTDGLAILMGMHSHSRVCKALEYAEHAGFKEVILPEISTQIPKDSRTILQTGSKEEFLRLIRRLLDSPAVAHPGGKLLISSYQGDKCLPEAWKEYIAELKKEFPEKLLFTVEMRQTAYRLAGEYTRNGGKISKRTLEQAKENLRSYLRVADGINFSGSNHITVTGDDRGLPAQRFHADAYAKIIVPLFTSVMNEPEFKGKLLGLSAHKAYFYRNRLSHSVDEEGTRALRESLSIALAANPDYIILPEWNEINENTHLEPLVSDANTNARTIRALTGRKEPRNESSKYPNFILSFRQDNALGDTLSFELLGLPGQNDQASEYTVMLKLFDRENRCVYASSHFTFDRRKLKEQTLHLPCSVFAGHRYLRTELTLTENGRTQVISEGLPHVRFTLSPNLDLKYVKIPLRDMAEFRRFEARWNLHDSRLQTAGVLDGDAELSTVDLLADDIPMAAVDPKQEYRVPQGEILLRFCRFVTDKIGRKAAGDRWSITAVTGKLTGRKTAQNALAGMEVPEQSGNTLSGTFGGGAFAREVLFSASPDAILEIDCRGEKIRVPVGTLLRNRIFRKTLDYSITWELELVSELPEVPYPLHEKHVKFTFDIPLSDRKDPVYSIRAVTMDGRVFRSHPFHPAEQGGEKIPVLIRERAARRIHGVETAEHTACGIRWRFTPESGDILISEPSNRQHHALLGGYAYYMHPRPQPADGKIRDTAPAWCRTEKGWSLVFKNGSYLMIPPPAFTQGAFRLRMGLKLNDMEDQTLLGTRSRTLELRLRKHAMLLHIRTSDGRFSFRIPKIALPPETFQMELVYDLKKLRVLIDGKETGAFPVTGTLEEPPLAFLTPHGILNNLELKHIATAHPGKNAKSIVRQRVSPPSHTSAVFRREIQARGPMP